MRSTVQQPRPWDSGQKFDTSESGMIRFSRLRRSALPHWVATRPNTDSMAWQTDMSGRGNTEEGSSSVTGPNPGCFCALSLAALGVPSPISDTHGALVSKVLRTTSNLQPTGFGTTPWVKKTRHQTLAHNFTKYQPIFTILLLLDSAGNL